MANSTLHTSIQSALQALSPVEGPTAPLREAALSLLDTLGYRSDKTIALPGSQPGAFLELIRQSNPDAAFDPKKALFADWKSADLLFQLTDNELSREASLFPDTEVKPGLLRSYLFFAIELKGGDYARGKLTAIARQINRVFPMPVMVLIKHGGTDISVCDPKSICDHKSKKQTRMSAPLLSIAVINRRRNKLRAEKDVLEKATIIRDISLTAPHRGHLEILSSFALENLQNSSFKLHPSFDSLHAAWEEVFNVELLNKKFYRELSNWFFWAMRHAHFPLLDEKADKYFLFKDREKVREHEAKNLIRLLTRILFVWFIKQKNLVPEALFDPDSLRADFLEDFDPESETSSTYYQAILQNLFFASLNQTHGKREFRKTGQHHNTTTLLRYESRFKDPQKFIDAVEAVTPFLNGGLFDCLDYPHPTKKGPQGGTVTIYEDGFSDRKDNPLVVPDFLFFGAQKSGVDLSPEYGDPKRKNESVRGLIHILDGYKFTIVENTPIEQEIALDPELLGQVFENLLASYNEETKTTARKQTGSFYTPRTIVDYMVDESLKTHLKQKVEQTFLSATFPNKTQTGISVPSTIKTRRILPHWKKDGAIYWVTFRMADSLPQEKLRARKEERDLWGQTHPEPWDEATWQEYNERFGEKLEAWLDAGMGSCALARPDIREAVKSCLMKFHGDRLIVHSAIIMPNHLHALIEPLPLSKSDCDTGIPACDSDDCDTDIPGCDSLEKTQTGMSTPHFHDLSKLLQGIKGASAREANKILGTTGTTFWMDESFDHIVRSEAQYQHYLRYIADNPVKAGLRDSEYSLLKGDTGILACDSDEDGTGIPAFDSLKRKQTGMSAPLSQRLDQLFAYSEETPQFLDAEKDVLITAIDEVKILDPACGSGAFPMGALQKLVYILGKLDPRDELWEKRQLAKVDKLIEAAQDIDDATFRESAVADAEAQRRDIEEAFANNELGYGRKLYLIENCLYGVDIQSIATQVSKLRFFISLIVDQKVDRDRENFGVRPLPNLETKFVTADTLIRIEKPGRQAELFELAEVSQIQKELKRVRHNLFSAKTPRTKRKYREEDERLRAAIAQELKQSGWSSDAADKLAAWDPYDQNASAPYFDPEWMFGLPGFDIVIGNPPYIQIQKFPKAQKDKWVAQNFQTYAATADIYCLFYERGMALLNEGGHLAYITSNKWMRAGYGEKLRGYLASEVDTHAVLDFGMAQNFSAATTYTCITQINRAQPQNRLLTCYAKDDRAAMRDPRAYFEENAVVQSDLSDLPWVILSPERHAIKKQVEAQGVPLGEWDIEINYGIKTGYNDAFYLSQQQRDAFVAQEPKCADYLVPLLRGRYVSRYKTDWDGTWMINSHNGVKSKGIPPVNLKKECPLLWNHLKQFEPQLSKRQDKGDHWSNLRNCAYVEEFEKPKIIYQDIAQSLPFYFDRDVHFYFNNTCWMMSGNSEHMAYLTAVFNSPLFRFCFKDNFPEYSGNAYRLFSIFFEKIPIKKPTSTEATLFEKLVPLVQSAKKSDADIPVYISSDQPTDRNVCATLEDLIDACVMECYFREHMAERDLQFQDAAAAQLSDFNPAADQAEQHRFIETLHQRLTEAKIPERLQRISKASPELLGVILKERKV